MTGVKDPQESYEVTENGAVLQVTEYGPEDEFLLSQGFSHPNFTQIPHELLGTWKDGVFIIGMMTDMSESELKVCLALCRITFGFQERDEAAASLSWLEKATGLSRQGVLNGIERLVKRGLFIKDKSPDGRNLWRKVHGGSQRSRLEVVNEVDQGSQRSRPKKESINKEKENPPRKKSAEEEPIEEVEYVEYDEDGFPEKPIHPLVKYIERNARRNLTDNQRTKLARGVPWHNPEHPSPCTLFEKDPLFTQYIDDKIAWATGGKDGAKKQTQRLVNAIRNYDQEHYGWLNFKQEQAEVEQASPARQWKEPDEPSQEDVEWQRLFAAEKARREAAGEEVDIGAIRAWVSTEIEKRKEEQ